MTKVMDADARLPPLRPWQGAAAFAARGVTFRVHDEVIPVEPRRGRDEDVRLRRTTARAIVAFLLLLLPPPLLAQQATPLIVYIYRDSLKAGVDSAYRALADEGAQICADLQCPNPYLGLESSSGPHEAWWLNTFATEADTARVVSAYAANPPLTVALGAVTKRKDALIGTPIQGFAVHRPELSRGPAWSVAGARFILITVTRSRRPAEGSVWGGRGAGEQPGCENLRRAPELEHAGAGVGRGRSGFLAVGPGAEAKALTVEV